MEADATTEAYWLATVKEDGEKLCASVKEATAAGVPDSLLLPALIGVFREAGMLPDFDYGSLLGLLRS